MLIKWIEEWILVGISKFILIEKLLCVGIVVGIGDRKKNIMGVEVNFKIFI